ncbi:MAG TPA: TIGR03560 family F420-dependent LLM class oxidoreductase [Verrucomicrobiae bacterium]|jgi:F420-dependent oxidoreductase-like protein|nr:TIGR03560 family F420-dependent LLM class oxidoreductase [Verrucomicrobiae bacterium]
MPSPHPVRIGAAFWVQRTDWPSLRAALETADAAGANDLWIDDHLLTDEGDASDGKLEGWTTLAAAAAVTTRARLGLLVSANTFRNPGLTAKLATTLDHLSAGRAILGLGGGWFEEEHTAFGLDFGSGFGERLDRLAESVEVIRRLLDGERFSHDGRFHQLRDALAAPRPVQPHLPILIGGSGPQKTLRIVARHADLWNAYGSPASLAASDAILRERCAEVGRDRDEIERTVNLNVVVRSTRADAARVWTGYAEAHRPREGEGRLVVGGPVEAVAEALAEYVAVGFRHPILIFRSPWDLETIRSLGAIREAVARLV